MENDSKLAKESIRARALVKQHLVALNIDNIYLVSTLKEMLDISINLYKARCIKESIKHHSITNIDELR
jgi:hypothetical protein